MISLQQACQYVESGGGDFVDLSVNEDQGFLIVRLAQPEKLEIRLVVHPIEEQQVLRIRALQLGNLESHAGHLKALHQLNERMLLGAVKVDGDGDVYFDIAHACVDDGEKDPEPEVLHRLVTTAVDQARQLAKVVMFMRRKGSRLPNDVIEHALEDVFGAPEPAEEPVSV